MPVTGDYVPPREEEPHPTARAFLFGRPNTAMNMQRRNLRDDIWPHIPRESGIEWHQVGELPGSKDDSWRWLEQNFTVHGFIEDLGSIFRPGDLCLIPYRDDTGFRAKFTMAAAHGMVNIGYEETFRCATEFVPGENCLAARSGEHFAELLQQYASDEIMRRRLAAASRALYEERFTLKAHLATYETIVRRSSEHKERYAQGSH
jgi:glycosyltransferase involved in cell wall biosynthesis